MEVLSECGLQNRQLFGRATGTIEEYVFDVGRWKFGNERAIDFLRDFFFGLEEGICAFCLDGQNGLTVVYHTPIGFGRPTIC